MHDLRRDERKQLIGPDKSLHKSKYSRYQSWQDTQGWPGVFAVLAIEIMLTGVFASMWYVSAAVFAAAWLIAFLSARRRRQTDLLRVSEAQAPVIARPDSTRPRLAPRTEMCAAQRAQAARCAHRAGQRARLAAA